MSLQFSTHIFQRAIIALCVTLVSGCLSTPPPAPTPTIIPSPTLEPPVDAFTMNRRLARTVSIGNALEAPKEGD